jgi:DNA-binding CsgD family transcriptional regulator
MDEAERLSRLIGHVYDATLDPELWPDALTQTAQFARGSAAGLFWKDVSSKSGGHVVTVGLEPRYTELYFEKYVKIDPVSTGQFLAAIEEPVATGDVIPYDEFLKTRMYREWARPQQLVDCVTAVLEKTATSAAMLGIFRHERDGIADADMRRRMRLIVPHIRRAVLVARTIDLKNAEAASFADTLDGISAAMFLVDAAGRIVHVNAAARVLLDRADVLRAGASRLVARDREADQVLADVFAAADTGGAAIGVTLTLAADGGARYVAHVLPLTSGARRRVGHSYSAVAALFVYAAAPSTLSCPEAIMKAYKLTPAELRVLLAIVEVGGIPAAAQVLGIGTETVRTHLRHLYEKTGLSRQLDLAKIVGRFSNPLLS